MRSMTHAMTPAVRSRRVIGSFLFYALLHGLESRSGLLAKTAGFLGHQEKGRQIVLHCQLIAFLGAQNKRPGGQSVGPHAELVYHADRSQVVGDRPSRLRVDGMGVESSRASAISASEGEVP